MLLFDCQHVILQAITSKRRNKEIVLLRTLMSTVTHRRQRVINIIGLKHFIWNNANQELELNFIATNIMLLQHGLWLKMLHNINLQFNENNTYRRQQHNVKQEIRIDDISKFGLSLTATYHDMVNHIFKKRYKQSKSTCKWSIPNSHTQKDR